MTKHYTDLKGAQGEQIQFGARHFLASLLFPGRPPCVRIGLGEYPLEHLSPLGATFRVEGGVAHSFDDEPLVLTLTQAGTDLVQRDILRPTQLSGDIYECLFVDRAIDIEVIVAANTSALAMVVRPAQKRGIEVPLEYKVFCADVIDFLGGVRRQLDQEIEPIAAELSPVEIVALDREVEEIFRPQWQAIIREGNALTLPHQGDNDLTARIKRYTENTITPAVCESPVWDRAYSKPLGYPGDFKVMNSIYDHEVAGPTVYMRLLAALGFISANPVALRMRSFRDAIIDVRQQNAARDHLHMMSIGAGSAREVREFFDVGQADGCGFSFTLVDTEPMALDCAIKSIYGGVRTGLSSVIVSGMNTSFTEMLRPTATFRHLPPQDFIYSAGLTDYLTDKLTRNLVRKLYDHVRPGGKVVIGNINNAPDGMYWAAECVLDWTMYFRTQSDMEYIAGGLPGDIEISLDQSGSYYLLSVTKPA